MWRRWRAAGDEPAALGQQIGVILWEDPMSYARYTVLFIVLTALAPGQPLAAQSAPPEGDDPSPADTAAWRPVLVYVLERIAPYTLRAATDSVTQPWRLTFAAEGAFFEAVENHLRVILNARDVLPTDSVFYELSVGHLELSQDTARVRIISGETRRCQGTDRVGGFQNTDHVFVPRHRRGDRTFWGAARTAGIRHGDRLPCGPIR